MAEAHNILITGGAGYLGSVLVPALLGEGHRVTVLDNFMFRQNSLAQLCAEPRFQVVAGDARDAGLLKPLVAEAEIIIPLAALVGAPICDGDETAAISTNRDAIATLLGLASPDQRVITPISNSGYGIGQSGKFCTEETPMRPLSLYGRTKVEAEEMVLAHPSGISLRLATVFGMAPRMRIDLLVNDFVHRAVNDRAVVLFESHFKRNFIHIGDVARAFLHAMRNFETMRGEAYNVGLSDANLSKRELCEKIRAHLPDFAFLEAPIGEDPDKRDYIVSNAKIEATGFAPAFSLDDGIRELIKGYAMLRNSVYGNM